MIVALQPTDKLLIDKIIYLASLASAPKEIDHLLNEVRLVTARVEGGQLMTPTDRGKLEEVQRSLIIYLTTKDKLRTFTTESLSQRLETLDKGTQLPPSPHKPLYAVWAVGVIAFLLPLIMPLGWSVAVRGQLGISLLFTVVSVGAVVFYLRAVRNFKPELKAGFVFICAGTLLVGISQFQLPITTAFNLTSLPMFRYGGFVLPYLTATTLMFCGLTVLARQVGLRTRLTSPLLAAGLTGLVALVVVLPHASQPASELFFDLALVGLGINCLLAVLGAILALRVSRIVSRPYARAMQWQFVTLGMAGAGSMTFFALVFWRGELQGPLMGIAAAPFVISALAMVQSGYEFMRASKN